MNDTPKTLADWNARLPGFFPGEIGLRLTRVEVDEVTAELEIRPELLAGNGYLHAGVVVTLADSCCGYGALKTLPEGASGFTTINLSSSFLSTAREGIVACSATPVHLGGATQVWDAVVSSRATGRAMAHFRCTQMILRPRG